MHDTASKQFQCILKLHNISASIVVQENANVELKSCEVLLYVAVVTVFAKNH